MHLHPSTRPFEGRAEVGRFLAILGGTAVAVTQPVLDVLGRSPETFIFRGAVTRDLVALGVVVAVLPPLVLWGLGFAVGLAASRWRRAVHGATLGVLLALAVVQAVAALPPVIVVGAGVTVALGAIRLLVQFDAVHLWLRVLSILSVFSVGLFVAASESSDAVGGGQLERVDSTSGRPISPVVLIVVDELPTSSIVDASGAIDPLRFPNLARFSSDATWYRNSTTVSGYTDQAVPAIFTGQVPTGVPPLFTDHPDNIFRLLGDTHELVVDEALTRLCPRSACGDGPSATGRSSGSGADLGELLRDAVGVWTDRITGSASRNDALGGFQESVVFESDRATEATVEGDDEHVAELQRVTSFVNALEPGERPLGAVIHLVLPHYPWRYLPDGRAYADPSEASRLANTDFPDAWTGAVQRQRHLLQATYTDALIGQILDRLRDEGIYDDATIAVAADHGVSFQTAQVMRVLTPAAAHEILWAPLLIKAPHQDDAAVDDRNIETVDILPTIADHAGLAVPWEVDGRSAASATAADRGDTKRFYRFPNLLEADPPPVTEIDASSGLAAMLADTFPTSSATEDPVAGLYQLSGRPDLYGSSYAPTESDVDAAPRIDDLDRLRTDGVRVLAVSGALASGTEADHVVVAIDGRIVGISPIITRDDGRLGFVLLLPAEGNAALDAVRVGLVVGSSIIDTGTMRS